MGGKSHFLIFSSKCFFSSFCSQEKQQKWGYRKRVRSNTLWFLFLCRSPTKALLPYLRFGLQCFYEAAPWNWCKLIHKQPFFPCFFKTFILIKQDKKKPRQGSPYLTSGVRVHFCSKVLFIFETECVSGDKGVAIAINHLYLNMSIHCTRERFSVNSQKVN